MRYTVAAVLTILNGDDVIEETGAAPRRPSMP